ncbi:MAG: DUF2968 domain-containing protein [Pigmentiphaga sp.]|uniref:DUF2968 domain-containing protein n=1 Tax=Pigmentiphaga sp. TaxID=1977564 RepID=UPI0029AB96BB|nr:DUF2968 domain-containing protein [Pigmentiphaga sp.]MDX3907747.1 DUF2968 domain-containing protein [Pigmentiphaga sp.]
MFQEVGFGLLLSAVSLGASAQVVQNTTAKPDAVAPAAQSGPADSGQTASANSTMAELQQLIQNRALNELRTTYNGNYGASLLFKADDLTYYVALFQQKNFWRVLKTTSESQAEQTYKAFVEQTVQLADVDIRRIKLDAERAVTEKLISANETRLTALQNDLTMQRQQEQQVQARQEQARQEAAALANERQAAREQLNALQRQIRMLEEQQAKLENAGVGADTKRGR